MIPLIVNVNRMTLVQEISMYSDWYWEGWITLEMYYDLCDAAIVWFNLY